MARVNITVPDELMQQARAAGLNVSRLASAAIADELDRQSKIAELDVYIAELEAEFGAPSPEQQEKARRWAEGLVHAAESAKAANAARNRDRSA